uniref:Uncharacterized protein n=1 Tax=Chromera velia CCMP2878 TaxID=1169474 RepID=A0A0G4IDJ9_9ALVE|eukprot:Cvel_13453.t1-p1 / transcript=Cvel_13453.t1 / gene=Cvel_13453 / organism=Chromera_velia_CCMP2878 / gene_product=hypothetical protein / transcript_product=hypothetical protein / location=Cvel_scaffold919:43753-44034(-) / protein_length=94 / sequence_SO=supercontig / SO=protein_coding / is_pseudo=false
MDTTDTQHKKDRDNFQKTVTQAFTPSLAEMNPGRMFMNVYNQGAHAEAAGTDSGEVPLSSAPGLTSGKQFIRGKGPIFSSCYSLRELEARRRSD